MKVLALSIMTLVTLFVPRPSMGLPETQGNENPNCQYTCSGDNTLAYLCTDTGYLEYTSCEHGCGVPIPNYHYPASKSGQPTCLRVIP